MSKAFTKESDDDEDGDVALPAIPAGAKNYITPQGYQRIKDELLQLIDVERPEVVRIVHWAASNGDRSENGDYIYGKRRQRHTITILGIDELDPLKGKISWVSPVARALTKAREGDVVTLQTPAGVEELEILEVSYPAPTPD